MQGNDLLHELDILHQADEVVGEELDGRHGAHTTRIQSGGMHVAAFHQAEHLPGHAAHYQSFAIEGSGEGIERGHDIGNGAVAMRAGVRSRCRLRFRPNLGIGLLDHLLAEVHADQIVLEDIVIEHVLGRFAEIDDPLGDRRRFDPERHILRIRSAGSVIVAADTADATGNEVSVARVFALHEDAVPAKDGRGAVALDHMLVLEVDLGKNAQAAHDPGDRVPVHFHQVPLLAGNILGRCGNSAHLRSLLWILSVPLREMFSVRPSPVVFSVRPRVVPGGQFRAGMTPLRLFVGGTLGHRAQGTNRAAISANR